MTANLSTRRSRLTALVVAVALVLAAAVALVASPSSGAEEAGAGPAAQRAVTHTVELAVFPKLAAPKTKTPPVPHDLVAPAAPTGFRITGPAFDIPAKVCGMDNVRPLDPPGDQYHTVCWVQEGFGVAPGVGSGGTSYILGHSWAQAPLVLTPLSTTAMAHMDMAKPVALAGVPTYPTTAINGYKIILTTPNGVLTYTVDSAYAVSKSQAANVAPLMAEKTPNRVVIITCGVDDGQDVDVNIIVNATLTSSQKA
ncbi:sortase domain-containing protein [Jatrophihabitans sp. YIM 134969]